MSGVVLVSATLLAMLALLAFAVSVVGFLIQTSRHRPTRGWSVAAGASLVLHLVFGGIANAVRSWSSPSPSEVQASTPNAVKQATHDATATVTRVVDGDTIEISRSAEGLLTERLIGVDTPETHGRTQPYGPEASNFTRQNLEGKEVLLELDVEKVDPYGRLLAYVYLPDKEMLDHSSDGSVAQGRLPVEIRRLAATIHVRELAATCVLAT